MPKKEKTAGRAGIMNTFLTVPHERGRDGKMKKVKLGKKDAVYLIIIGVLVISLLVSIFLPIIVKKAKNKDYYESKCESYAVQNTNLSRGQIIFIGDSITDLYPLDDYYADLPLASYNRGIGGDTTSGVLKRLDVSAIDLAPSKIVLMIGTNDVNGTDSVSEIADRYGEILDRLEAALPNTEIICMSVIPQNEVLEEYTDIDVAKSTERIHALNSKIAEMTNARAILYLDLYSRLADENDRLIRTYSDDGIHLNAKGFEVWTELLKPYLT